MNDDKLEREGAELIAEERRNAHELAKWKHEEAMAKINKERPSWDALVGCSLVAALFGAVLGAALAL